MYLYFCCSDAYCLYTMRDNFRIRALPACEKPGKAKCSDHTVGPNHTVTVCEGLIKNYKCKLNKIYTIITGLNFFYACTCVQSTHLNVTSMDHVMTLPRTHALPPELRRFTTCSQLTFWPIFQKVVLWVVVWDFTSILIS